MTKINISFILLFLFSQLGFAQNTERYISQTPSLNQAGALELFAQANNVAQKMNRNVTVAVLDASGVTILLIKNDSVGVHNTEASRRKAFTALSTQTASYQLMHNAALNKDANNLNTLPELLLLGGGVPIWFNHKLIGSIGVSGGGSGENDDSIAKQAIENAGFSVIK
ncbi:MAG: heme-binding protein [Bacteroidales bacterium]|nr:heme-binding protein [Bacteroidales bacterium]